MSCFACSNTVLFSWWPWRFTPPAKPVLCCLLVRSDPELMLIKAAHRSRFTVTSMTGNIPEELVGVTAGEDTLEGNLSIPGAIHLFEESGALDEVARLAREWFELHLLQAQTHSAAPRTQKA
jgi:hypothetical protein